jgi:[acyl-carrier-protein] S-malonyltransferase
MPLNVSAAFHSPLMANTAQKLAHDIEQTEFFETRSGVVANSSAQTLHTPAEFRRELVEQITAPVLWISTIEAMVQQGISKVIEIGPGSVLTGLIKRIAPELPRHNVSKWADV